MFSLCLSVCQSRSGYPPPWIPKLGGLESSGRRLISLNGKTWRIDFFFIFLSKKNIYKYRYIGRKRNVFLSVFVFKCLFMLFKFWLLFFFFILHFFTFFLYLINFGFLQSPRNWGLCLDITILVCVLLCPLSAGPDDFNKLFLVDLWSIFMEYSDLRVGFWVWWPH